VAHQLMKIQVEDMVDQYESMRRDPVRVMRVLEQWLVEHVQKEDRAMAQWLFAPWDPAGPGARAGHKQP